MHFNCRIDYILAKYIFFVFLLHMFSTMKINAKTQRRNGAKEIV